MSALTHDALGRMATAFANEARFRPGDRAELKRARSPEELRLSPVFYRLAEIAGVHPDDTRELDALTAVVWILPAMPHRVGAPPVGRVLRTTLFGDLKESELARGGIRLRQLLAARNRDSVTLALRLRKLLVHAAQKAPSARIDVGRTGRDLAFWNDATRKRWAADIYLSPAAAVTSAPSV